MEPALDGLAISAAQTSSVFSFASMFETPVEKEAQDWSISSTAAADDDHTKGDDEDEAHRAWHFAKSTRDDGSTDGENEQEEEEQGPATTAVIKRPVAEVLAFGRTFFKPEQWTPEHEAAWVSMRKIYTVDFRRKHKQALKNRKSAKKAMSHHPKKLCTSLNAQGNDADLSNTLVVVIDLNTLDHLLVLLATYPTTSRMPDNMKPATYGLLVHILSVDPPSVVRAALHFINDVVVSLSSSSSDNTLCELAAHMLTTKLVPAMLSSLAGLADPMDDDDDAAGTRARFVDVLTAAMTTVSHRALKHVDALCSFVATTLKRPRRRSRRRHVASVGAIDDNPNDLGATEVSLALYVMSIALTHAYDEYHVRFVRDGVYQALEGVAHEPVATANTHAATQLLATYKSNTTTTPALDALAALARDLRGSSNAGVGAVVLRLANVFRSTDGVTSYELTTSAVVPALVEYIQASTDDFREMVATMSDVRWVVALVATVKEAVVSQWNPHDHPTRPWTDGLFPSVVASMTTSGRPVAHVMNLLAQHLNVRLHVNPVMGSSAIADTTTTTTVVLVEPLARVDTMQAFVAAKMFGKDQHHHHEVDDEEDVTATEMQQQEDGEDNTRIRTTLDGHVLPPSMTILEALIRSKTCGWTNDYEGDEDQPWGP
ncbi:hypothetical protein DYB30_013341, partial [Aphanomyces astaci]